MQTAKFDPGLTQQYTGALRRAINKDGTFNVLRRGTSWRDVHPYLHLVSMPWLTFFGTLLLAWRILERLDSRRAATERRSPAVAEPGSRLDLAGGLLHTRAALPWTSVERRDPVPAPLHTTVQRVIVDPVEDRQGVRPVRLPPALPKIMVELEGRNARLIVIPLTAGAAARAGREQEQGRARRRHARPRVTTGVRTVTPREHTARLCPTARARQAVSDRGAAGA